MNAEIMEENREKWIAAVALLNEVDHNQFKWDPLPDGYINEMFEVRIKCFAKLNDGGTMPTPLIYFFKDNDNEKIESAKQILVGILNSQDTSVERFDSAMRNLYQNY